MDDFFVLEQLKFSSKQIDKVFSLGNKKKKNI